MDDISDGSLDRDNIGLRIADDGEKQESLCGKAG
jgi:hypothetical protein